MWSPGAQHITVVLNKLPCYKREGEGIFPGKGDRNPRPRGDHSPGLQGGSRISLGWRVGHIPGMGAAGPWGVGIVPRRRGFEGRNSREPRLVGLGALVGGVISLGQPLASRSEGGGPRGQAPRVITAVKSRWWRIILVALLSCLKVFMSQRRKSNLKLGIIL